MSAFPGSGFPGITLPGGPPPPIPVPNPVALPPKPATTISAPVSPAPQTFRSTDGTIQGTMDGANPVFMIQCLMRRAQVWRNGQLMTLNVDCVVGQQAIVFLSNQVPQPGDIIKVDAWL